MKEVFLENDQQKKDFSISFVVFSAFKNKWPKRKKEIDSLITKDPSKTEKGEEVIKQTEAEIEYFSKGARIYSAAATEAKEEYNKFKDQKIGTGDKIMDFFGFSSEQKNLENTPLFSLENKKFEFKQQGGQLSIKQILHFDVNLVPFLDNPDPLDAKQRIYKMLSYRDILEGKKSFSFDEKEISNLEANLENFDIQDHFKNQTLDEQQNNEQQSNSVLEKIREKAIEVTKAYHTRVKEKDRNRDYITNLVKLYTSEPVIAIVYKFGTDTNKMSQNPFFRTLQGDGNKIIFDEKKINKFMSDLLAEVEIKVDSSKLLNSINEKDWNNFVQVITGSSKKTQEEPVNKQTLKNFMNLSKKELEKVQEKPPLFLTIQEDKDTLNERSVFKIDDIYLIGNEFFKGLSSNEDFMSSCQSVLSNNPNKIASFSEDKIKKIFENIKSLEKEKIEEMKKDLERVLENKGYLQKKYKEEVEVFQEDDWKEIEQAITSGDSKTIHDKYLLIYEWFKEYKPELLKILQQDWEPQEKQEIEKVVDKLQEISPVFSSNGNTNAIYMHENSPWRNWGVKNVDLLNSLAKFSKEKKHFFLTDEQIRELSTLPDLKLKHVKAQLKAYMKTLNDQEEIKNKIEQKLESNDEEKILELHARLISDINESKNNLNYSEYNTEDVMDYLKGNKESFPEFDELDENEQKAVSYFLTYIGDFDRTKLKEEIDPEDVFVGELTKFGANEIKIKEMIKKMKEEGIYKSFVKLFSNKKDMLITYAKNFGVQMKGSSVDPSKEKSQGLIAFLKEKGVSIERINQILNQEEPGAEEDEESGEKKKQLINTIKSWTNETKGSDKNLFRAFLQDADLSGADLSVAYLGGANLNGANLRGANLSKASLNKAFLQDADLRDADLRGADLSDAKLSGANLSGANLKDATMKSTNIFGLKYNNNTIWPSELHAKKLKDSGVAINLDSNNPKSTELEEKIAKKIKPLIREMLKKGNKK